MFHGTSFVNPIVSIIRHSIYSNLNLGKCSCAQRFVGMPIEIRDLFFVNPITISHAFFQFRIWQVSTSKQCIMICNMTTFINKSTLTLDLNNNLGGQFDGNSAQTSGEQLSEKYPANLSANRHDTLC